MDAGQEARQQKKQRLLRELAEIAIEEQVAEGVFLETPHYSIIEHQARTLGRELSLQAQERAAREVAANCETQAACPTCRSVCRSRKNEAASHEYRRAGRTDRDGLPLPKVPAVFFSLNG